MSKSGWLVVLMFLGSAAARAEDPTETRFVGGTVSVEELRNPLEGKSLRIIADAQRDLRLGHQERGMAQLRQALTDPGAMPYAVSMLGSEHLKKNEFDIALAELEQAVKLLPGHAENHSNLAYALSMRGQLERALLEARKALQLDPACAKTRFVLARILLQNPATEKDAIAHLKIAAEEIPSARKVLADYNQWTSAHAAATPENKSAPPLSSSPVVMSFQAARP